MGQHNSKASLDALLSTIDYDERGLVPSTGDSLDPLCSVNAGKLNPTFDTLSQTTAILCLFADRREYLVTDVADDEALAISNCEWTEVPNTNTFQYSANLLDLATVG